MSNHPQSKIPKKKTKPASGKIVLDKSPTLSYSQLKVEVSTLREENAELKQKLTKHQHASFSSKSTVRELQKENKGLKQRLDQEESQHTESLTACRDELTSKATFLETKLKNCEEALEVSGINPVTLAALEYEQEQKTQAYTDAMAAAQVLKEKLEENTNISLQNITSMEKISQQCQEMLKSGEMEGDSGVMTT